MPGKNQTTLKARRPDSARTAAAADDIARIAIGEDGNVVYASPSFCALSHMSLDQAKAIDIARVLSFDDGIEILGQVDTGLHKVRINGNRDVYDFHFNWMTAPDEKRYLIGSQAVKKKPPLSDAAMQEFVAKIAQLGRDNDNESRGISTQADLQTFIDMSSDVMIVTNAIGELLRVNKVFHDMFGTDDAALRGMDFIDLFEDEDRPFIRNSMQTLSFDSEDGDEHATQLEAQIKMRGGETRWMEWRQSRKDDLIFCVGRDVSEIKSQEKALSRRERQLLQAESIGRMGHWQWTIGHETIEWSAEIFRIFGVEDGKFEPTLENMNKMVNRRDIARVNQAFQRAIIEQNDYDVEFRINRPDGAVRFIRCEGRCARDDEGDVFALYGVMQDMTERMAYESNLREAKDAAERAYAAKSQFLANMSHELRTPLNAIIGFSEMMQRQLLGPIGTEKYLDYIDGIRESGEHLLDLISDILDMSKIEAGKYELDLIELNVCKAVGMATHMMEGRALEAGIKITTEGVNNEALVIIADRRAFMQILLNLLSNAVKFSSDNGVVRVECFERQDYIALKVADNGIGIPANKLAQITRPFEQASSSYAREHEGSGLGLAITKELVEMHGGTLFIDSTLGVGTTVTVRLPYDASKAPKKQSE